MPWLASAPDPPTNQISPVLVEQLANSLKTSQLLTPDSEGYADGIKRWSDAVEKEAVRLPKHVELVICLLTPPRQLSCTQPRPKISRPLSHFAGRMPFPLPSAVEDTLQMEPHPSRAVSLSTFANLTK